MFDFLTTFTPTKGLLKERRSGVWYARDATGEMVELSSLDGTAREAAAIAIVPGDEPQTFTADISALDPPQPAGNYYMDGWEEEQDMTEGPVARAMQWPLFWDGTKEVVTGTLQLVTTPIVTTVSDDGEIESITIVAYQHAALGYTFIIVDGDGDAIDLSGKSISFSAYRYPGQDNAFVLTTGDGEITVGGDDDNQVIVAKDDSVTEIAGDYRFNLRNTTDDTLLSRGVLLIVAENDAVEPS